MGQKLTRYATTEKAITLADSPYTASPNFNCIKVNTAGGNVRVNLPVVDYPIDVIKTSSDAYIVTIWVGGTQIGEVAGELSVVTVENSEVTKDEPWYPYDAIVGIAGVSGDGGEVLAKDRYGRVIAGGRGVAGTDEDDVTNTVITSLPSGGAIYISPGNYIYNSPIDLRASTNIELFGHSRDHAFTYDSSSHATKLYKNFDGNLIEMGFASPTYCFHHIHDLSLGNYNTGYYTGYKPGICINIVNGHYQRIHDINIHRFETGININTCGVARYADIFVSECTYDGITFTDSIDTIMHDIESCNNGQSSGYACLNVSGDSVLMLNNAHFEGYNGIRQTGGHIQVSNLYIPQTNANSIYVKEAAAQFSNVWLWGGNINDDQTGNNRYTVWLDGDVTLTLDNAHIDTYVGGKSIGSIVCNTGASYNMLYLLGVKCHKTSTFHNNGLFSACAFHDIVAYVGNVFNGCSFGQITNITNSTVNGGIIFGTILSRGTSMIINLRGYIAPGEVRTASGSLTAGNADAIAFAWHNPEAQDIYIRKVIVAVTTPGGTAGSILDVGIADDATYTNGGTELLNDVDLNTAGLTDQIVSGVLCQDSASATDGWVVGKILTANAASLVGKYYIEYMGA